MGGEDQLQLRSAEEWLAARGVERRPIVVRLDEPQPDFGPTPPPTAGGVAAPGAVDTDDEFPDDGPDMDFTDELSTELPEEVARALAEAAAPLIPIAEPGRLRAIEDRPADGMTPPRAIEATRVAEAAQEERHHLADLEAAEPRDRPSLSDDVAIAISYVRQATALAPMSEGRLRGKLADRGNPPAVIELTLERARRERLVDDEAFATALVGEWQAKGHAGARIRMDLRTRGFDNDFIANFMARMPTPDPEAAAFAVAMERVPSLSGLDPETAMRRLVAHVARRGHGEGLARKVARQALWAEREREQTSGH